MKRAAILAAVLCLAASCGQNAPVSESFEMRWFTTDAAADGETDFRGETEWLTTGQRVQALGQYASFASEFWGNPGLDTPVVSNEEIADALAGIKPQPLTEIRRTIPLDTWKATGETFSFPEPIQSRFQLDSVDWRFRMHATISCPTTFHFFDKEGTEAFWADVNGPEVTIYADLENNRPFFHASTAPVQSPLKSFVTNSPIPDHIFRLRSVLPRRLKRFHTALPTILAYLKTTSPRAITISPRDLRTEPPAAEILFHCC